MSAARRRALLLGVALALLQSACSDEPAPPPPVVLRLWRGEEAAAARKRASVREDAAEKAAGTSGQPAAAPPAQEATLYATHFGEGTVGRDAGWFRVAQDPGAQGVLVLWPITPTEGRLGLSHKSGWAAVTALAVGGGEALSVSVTAHVPRGNGGAAAPPTPDLSVATLVELRDPLDPAARLTAEDVGRLLDSHRHASHELTATLSGAPRTVKATFVTDLSTRFLAIYLLAPVTPTPEAIVVDGLQVTRMPLAAFVAAGGDIPRLQRLDRSGGVRVSLDRDDREGLFALPGARYAFDLGPSVAARRLELAWGVAPRHPAQDARPDADTIRLLATARGVGADGVAFHVEVGETLAAPASVDEPAWLAAALELPASPSAPLLLELRADGEGSDPPLAVFGHPTVLAPRVPAAETPAGTSAAPPSPPPRVRPNVVLISLDTLRPDRLGCYGNDKGLTPSLDALAAQGLRFTQAESTSSWTLPSHGSLLTGQYPAFHGAVDPVDRLDPARSPFLAQLLADAGYVTAAFTGGGYVAPSYGFAHGFDRYSSNDPVWALDTLRGSQLLQTISWELAPQQVPLLRRYASPMIADWIGQQQAGVPFFVFLHTYIVHNYAPDEHWLEKLGLLAKDGKEQPFNHQDREHFNAEEAGAGEDTALRARVYAEYMPYYEATVGMADEFVGSMLAALEQAGLANRTLVIVTADHGEEFGEHGFFGHGQTLFETNTHVPLIVRLPAGTPESVGGASPAVLDAPISLVDIAPWILRIAGVSPDSRMTVRAPLAPDRLAPPARSQLFIELDTHQSRLSAVRDGPLKLHDLLEGQSRGMKPGGTLLFDLPADPGELYDLSAARPADRARLVEQIGKFHALAEALHPRRGRAALDWATLDPETVEQLRQLGYLGPAGTAAPPAKGTPASPEDQASPQEPAPPQDR